MDLWATNVAYSLCSWVSAFREQGAKPWEHPANELLVLAGQDYVEPLRERGVFEYGIARMTADPNEGFTFPLDVRYLFEEIDAGGIGEQMGWLSEAVERFDDARGEAEQQDLAALAGESRTCEHCGASGPGASLVDVDGVTVCPDCHPEECARCGAWTRENGLGGYPLCPDCQTERGGQTLEPYDPDPTEQLDMHDALATTDGGASHDE
jgi:hypothetical protein